MRPLPEPTRGGSINELRPFLNVSSDADFVLIIAWLLTALRHRGPYPVLTLVGEQGSAKSFFMRLMRLLVDPNSAPLRTLPRDARDLFIAATNGHVIAFDNLSGMALWMSDALCRLATGGGFATRRLYTDQDETLLEAMRPIMLNGIDDILTRGDLADRALLLTLEPIDEDDRRPEEDLLADFEKHRSGILGALLDAVSHGIRELPDTHLDHYARMADFMLWVAACEGALWPAGTFETAYSEKLESMVETVLEADPVANAIRGLVTASWTGTASDLLRGLNGWCITEGVKQTRSFPTTPGALSGRIRRVAPFLRKVGFEVTFHPKDSTGVRRLTISRTDAAPPPSWLQDDLPF
jgi:hypothetical protein